MSLIHRGKIRKFTTGQKGEFVVINAFHGPSFSYFVFKSYLIVYTVSSSLTLVRYEYMVASQNNTLSNKGVSYHVTE